MSMLEEKSLRMAAERDAHALKVERSVSLRCAQELLDAEAEIERLEQLLIVARDGLRTALQAVRPENDFYVAFVQITTALRDSDPNKESGE